MQEMSTWEMLLLGALVVLVLFWMGPGIKATFEQSRQTRERDWRGVLIPLAIVVLFVFFLIKMV